MSSLVSERARGGGGSGGGGVGGGGVSRALRRTRARRLGRNDASRDAPADMCPLTRRSARREWARPADGGRLYSRGRRAGGVRTRRIIARPSSDQTRSRLVTRVDLRVPREICHRHPIPTHERAMMSRKYLVFTTLCLALAAAHAGEDPKITHKVRRATNRRGLPASNSTPADASSSIARDARAHDPPPLPISPPRQNTKRSTSTSPSAAPPPVASR